MNVVGEIDDESGLVVEYNEEKRRAVWNAHPLEEYGLPVLTALISIWFDEIKGTTSVTISKHETAALQILNVKPDVNRIPRNLGFVAATKNAPCPELAGAVCKDIKEGLEKGIIATVPSLDGKSSQTVVLAGGVGCFQGDAPKICIYCSHKGVRARFMCPFCLHEKGKPKTFVGTAGTHRNKKRPVALQNHLMKFSPSKQAEPYESEGVNRNPNPLMLLDHVDPHYDSVLDVLHLGPLGYVVFILHILLAGQQKPFKPHLVSAAARLEALEWSSFPVRIRGDKVLENSKSFVGRDSKIFIQVAHLSLSPRWVPRFQSTACC